MSAIRQKLDKLDEAFLYSEAIDVREAGAAAAAGGTPSRGVTLIVRRFRFRQTQEYENGAVERLHFFGGQ